MITIEREMFEAWLFNPAQPPERQFEYCNTEGECAICCFFKETYRTPGGRVEGGVTDIRAFRSTVVLAVVPEWWDCGRIGIRNYDFSKSLAHAARSRSNNMLTIASMRNAYIAMFGDPTASAAFNCPRGYGECENERGCVYPGRCGARREATPTALPELLVNAEEKGSL